MSSEQKPANTAPAPSPDSRRRLLSTAGGRLPAAQCRQEEHVWQQRILFRSAPWGLPHGRSREGATGLSSGR